MDAPPKLGRILVELILWLGLAGGAFALTFQFASAAGTYAWGAGSWPRGVLALIVIGALAQFAVRLRARSLALSGDAPEGTLEPEPAAAPPLAWGARIKRAAPFLLPLLYVFLLRRTGFYLTTPFFLAAYLALLGERRPAYLIGVPLAIFAGINVVFTKLFYVALPTGNWPFFYDFSNWFLVTVR